MFKVVVIRGGLGNQMFIYAFYFVLRMRYSFSLVLFEPVHCFQVHHGFELHNIFPRIGKSRTFKYYRRLQKIYSEYFTRKLFKIIREVSPAEFYPNFKSSCYPFLVYEGFWQSELYFSKYRAELLKIFLFDEKKLNANTLKLLADINEKNSVAVHIRRGDYLNNKELSGICSKTYYENAIAKIKEKIKDPVFYFFSDDPSWVKKNFSFAKYHLIDFNRGKDSWQDMYLMSKCKNNIIANSSFSWWGAWLNINPDKIIIAPSDWFKTIPDKDIVPENWIKI
jgi:hypothetical protein